MINALTFPNVKNNPSSSLSGCQKGRAFAPNPGNYRAAPRDIAVWDTNARPIGRRDVGLGYSAGPFHGGLCAPRLPRTAEPCTAKFRVMIYGSSVFLVSGVSVVSGVFGVLGFRVSRVFGFRLWVQGLGFGVWGLGFWGLRFRV